VLQFSNGTYVGQLTNTGILLQERFLISKLSRGAAAHKFSNSVYSCRR